MLRYHVARPLCRRVALSLMEVAAAVCEVVSLRAEGARTDLRGRLIRPNSFFHDADATLPHSVAAHSCWCNRYSAHLFSGAAVLRRSSTDGTSLAGCTR